VQGRPGRKSVRPPATVVRCPEWRKGSLQIHERKEWEEGHALAIRREKKEEKRGTISGNGEENTTLDLYAEGWTIGQEQTQ